MKQFDLNGSIHLIDEEIYEDFDDFLIYAFRNQPNPEKSFYEFKHEYPEHYEKELVDFIKIEMKYRAL